jgi:MFS family permease
MAKGLLALPRTVWLLGAISLLNDSASELLYPLVPLYLASVLAAGPRALGVIEGVAEATSSLVKLGAGWLADKQRRSKPWVVAGYFFAAVSRPLYAFTRSWLGVLGLRFFDRIGKGLRSAPRDALLARSVDAKQRGLAFGFHRAMDNAGAVIGPLLAAWFLLEGVPLRDVFLWAAVPGVLCVLLGLFLREPATPAPASAAKVDLAWTKLPPALKRYLLVLALFTLSNSSNAFILLRAADLGMEKYQVPLLWALVSGVATVFSVPLSALSDRVGRKKLILAGWFVYAASYFAIGSLSGPTPWIWAIYGVYGLFMAATEGAEKALVADLAPKDALGTAFGWFTLVGGLLLLPASLWFGWVWHEFGAALAFYVAAGISLVAAALLPLALRRM